MRAAVLPRPEAPPTTRVRGPRPDRETERIRLIEFVWTTRSGRQPVLYIERVLLH
jgi:hypothetical protein